MKERLLAVLLLAGAAAILAPLAGGCDYARRPNVIPDSRLRVNPRLAEGQRLFMRYCNQCHVGGAAGVGPSLNDKPLPGFLVRLQVRHSIGHMPRFSERVISDAQLGDILRYLSYLRAHPNGPPRA